MSIQRLTYKPWSVLEVIFLGLTGLPLRALHNRGQEPAVLADILRRRRESGDEFPIDSPSYQVSASMGRSPTKKRRR